MSLTALMRSSSVGLTILRYSKMCAALRTSFVEVKRNACDSVRVEC